MKILNRLKKVINNGRKGLNKGISTGIKGLDEKVFGIQKGWIYSILGGSGSGKTTMALFAVVYASLKEKLGDPKLNIIYYSLEMSSEVLFAKLLSLYIWDTHKVVISYTDMLSMKEVLSDDKYEIIQKSYEWLEKVEKHFIVYDKKLNANDLQNHLTEFFLTKGKFVEKGDNLVFVPKVEDEIYIAVLDHMKLLNYVTSTVKPEIDKACQVLVYFRNTCKLTSFMIQQINRNSQDMARKAADLTELQLNDAQDSSDTIQASEVVLGIYFPAREKVSQARKYSVQKTGKRLRICQIMKNRYGDTEISLGLMFYGELGYWRQLPKAEDMSDMDYESFMMYLESESENSDENNKEDESQEKLDWNINIEF